MAIVKSNSPGTITFSSSNENIVSLDGSVADPEGAGTAVITINQAETANYNAATATFNINVIDALRPPLDSDGDGVVDENDFAPNDKRVWSRDQFSFDAEAWGTTSAINRTSNGQLKEFYGLDGSGYLTTELVKSPIGWDPKITWKARTDLSWATFTKTEGNVTETRDGSDGYNNVIIRGDKATFNVSENNTDDSREGYLYVDYYYDGIFIKTQKISIKQREDKPVLALSDSTPVPHEADPEQTQSICSRAISPIYGGQTFPQKIEVNIGTATGPAEFYANPEMIPDRFVLVHGDEIKVDTGYITTGHPWGTGRQTEDLNEILSAKGLPDSTVNMITIYGRFYTEYYFHSWTKTSTDPKAYIYVYGPFKDTGWYTAVSCANQNLDNIRNSLGIGPITG